jgi:hypothetical protein
MRRARVDSLEGNARTEAAMGLEVGREAPDLTLLDPHGTIRHADVVFPAERPDEEGVVDALATRTI